MHLSCRRVWARVTTSLVLLFMLACAPTTGPVVPILPPLQIAAPDIEGNVRIDGDAEPEAQVFAFNETRGDGVIGTADAVGRYELVLRADAGDDIAVWQRVGTVESSPRVVTVPAP